MPYSYPTTPGVTYAVECAAEVFVTNPQTGAVAVSGDGSATVYFTATDTLYDISDDSAKVQPLFKLAPRLKLTLLQGVAGGLLPKGYTELEYLEASGTQWIFIPHAFDKNTGIEVMGRFTKANGAGIAALVDLPGDLRVSVLYYNASTNKLLVDEYGTDYGGTGVSVPFSEALSTARYNWKNSHILYVNNGTESNETTNDRYIKNYTASGINLFKGVTYLYSLFINSASVTQNENVACRLIPALRNADGVPGMWDTVSKQFFINSGSGTFGYRIKRTGETSAPMSLRDPHRVAPSGVYARKAGENKLDVVADTDDVTGDGWEWFANTGEAYDAYGIVIQEDFN